MINKCFTYKGFDKQEDAFEYAKKAAQKGASYIEIMIRYPKLKYEKKPIIVQHNAKEWIK